MTIAASGSSRLLPHAVCGLMVAVTLGCTPTGPSTAGTEASAPALQDCAAAEAGLEFFSPAVVNFDDPATPGQAKYLYGYADGTAVTNASGGYQPAATAADRCTGVAGNHAFHLTGGPFLGWGGGIGVAMAHLVTDAGCDPIPNSAAHDFCYPYSVDTVGETLSALALDMSQWEGVAVWARREPDSQPLLRVLVGNKDTDDDVSFWMLANDQAAFPQTNTPRYCERVKECGCAFQDAPCTYSAMGDPATSSPPGFYCGGPGATPGYANMAPSSGTGYSNKCDVSRCNDPYPAYAGTPDTAFLGKPCTAYTTRNGVLSSYCYDPATDPPPASGDQQCGDHFTFPLSLTTEWQLYLVPFSTMFQQGWAKRAAYFDLHTVSVVRLTWDAGNIDYWIDDLRFYRHKSPSP